MLLLRRDFVIATASYCDQFPALAEDRMLSDAYVPISIRRLADTTASATPLAQPDITAEGNHIIEGDGGSGKSTFLRHLARTEAEALLGDRSAAAFDDLRLPCFIRAADLTGSEDMATALHRAATASLRGRLRRPLPSDFFIANATHGHRNWLIFVDGLDEVESRQRREVWDIIRLHAEQESGLRFILTTRPEAVVPISTGGAFSRWTVEPVNSTGQAAFATSYISVPSLRDKFMTLLGRREHRYIGNSPLFLTMSAQLFAKTGELHRREIDLHERYTAYVIEKATGADTEKMSALSELLCLVAGNETVLADLVRKRDTLVREITHSFSAFDAEEALGKLLNRTALIRCNDGRCAFSHDLFRSYYRALDLSKQHNLNPRILREVEPFREGWAVVEQLLFRWDRDGLNVQPVLRSLLEYGDEGLQCAAHVIAATQRPGYDKVALDIAERFIREAKDSGPTILAHRILASLAEASVAVRRLLIRELDSTVLLSDTFIAECLLDAGEHEEALGHLLWVAERSDGYSPDRVTAAELLLQHDYREEALEALRDVAENGDEDWSKVDAASVLYAQERTEENRQILVDLCEIDESTAPDRIFSSTLSRLMAIGETELALPHLKATTRLPDAAVYRSLHLHQAIEAARSIAEHEGRFAGKQILEQMLTSSKKMREKAEIARALADLGFDQEARSALRSSLEASELEIDWFTVDQLVRLDMTDEARSAVETAVEHLLNGHHHAYDAVNLIEHALPLLDRQAMSVFILGRARSLKESMLARSLALLGAPEEARSLLSDFLADDDVDLRIRSAGELCELGDAKLGSRVLRIIARNRCFAPRNRLAAAEKLKSVGLLRHAAVAFARISRDDRVEVNHRTHAAMAFDKLEHRRNDVVWTPLMAILEDRTQTVTDRVDAAETLIYIDGDDGYDDLVYPELLAMLDDYDLSDRDVLRVGTSLGERGWTLDDMPRVAQILKSDEISPSIKVKTLRAIGRYGRNQEVSRPLIEIAAHPAASVELALEAIDAIWRSDEDDEAQALLSQISRNSDAPPAWRLKAAKAQRADLRSETLLFLSRDNSIDISTRVEALEALPADALATQKTLLESLANSGDLTFWDHHKIAETANRLEMPEIAEAAIRSAKNDQPLSIWEMVELAKLCRKLGDVAGAEQLQQELLSLPLVVLLSSEDTATVLEGIGLAAQFNNELAAGRLKEMLLSEELSWWSVAEALETYAKLVGRDQALAIARPITAQLSAGLRAPADEEHSGWLWHAGKLVTLGFYDDYEALLAFAQNEKNRMSERAGACALVMAHDNAGFSLRSIARSALSELLRGEPSASEKISVARELRRTGCYSEMDEWLNQCLANQPEDPEDRRDLASLLHDLGRARDAKAVVGSMVTSDLVKGHLFPADEALVKSVLDEEIIDDMAFRQILENDDALDQIWRAKEYVDEHGDHRALKILLDAAEGSDDDAHRQLEAIDCLDQLGFRELSRALFNVMPKEDIEPYWFGAQLLRFGKKSEAAPFYIEASHQEMEYNENLVWSGLADLELIVELVDSRSKA